MNVTDVRVISTSKDGKRRQVVYLGYGAGRHDGGRRRRKADVDAKGEKIWPRRQVSRTVHQRLTAEGWKP